ncbi:hypothetical protein [Psychroserpens burtonensis]|nr:hypothetical protein [Psychroserpens burtonensis]
MKKLGRVFLILFTISTVFISCRETTGDKVEDVVEDVADDVQDAVD